MTAICNMTAPTDIKELQTFLGLANYLGRFTPHLATVSAPLRDLCKTDVPYDWGPEHDAAFSNLKKAISSNEVLQYYDSTKPLVIQVDASQRGLGAALLHANGPIAFANKSLTETESATPTLNAKCWASCLDLSDSTNMSMDDTWKCIPTINRLSPSTPNISLLPHPDWHVCYSAYNSTT